MSETTSTRVFQLLTEGGDERVCKDIPDSACREEPRNFTTHVTALSASKIADGLIDPKLVLSWLLATMGAPAAFIGLLVPIREAGALLPQIFIAASLRQLPKRKWAWAAGAFAQGLSALAMAVAAVTLTGAALGFAIIAALTTLALARSVCSVTYKDVLGKTVSKSRRGTATGAASSVAAAAVLVFGAMLAAPYLPRFGLVAFGLFAAGALWIIGALIFSTLEEAAGATEGGGNAFN
ncbi:MAG: MFS transporter, partial [Pseudomonadota bacterium]